MEKGKNLMNSITNQNLNQLTKLSKKEVTQKFGSLYGRVVEWIKILPSEISKNRVQICKVTAVATLTALIFYGMLLIFQKKEDKTEVKEPIIPENVQEGGKGEQESGNVKQKEKPETELGEQGVIIKQNEKEKSEIDLGEQGVLIKQDEKESETQQKNQTDTKENETKADQGEKSSADQGEKSSADQGEKSLKTVTHPVYKGSPKKAEKSDLEEPAKFAKLMSGYITNDLYTISGAEGHIKDAAKAGEYLTRIKFSSEKNDSSQLVQSSELEELVNSCPNIEYLYIQNSSGLHDFKFLDKMQKLNTLELSSLEPDMRVKIRSYFAEKNIVLDHLSLLCVSKEDHSIDLVVLKEPTDEILNKFIDDNLNVEKLLIEDCSQITDLSCLLKLKDLKCLRCENCSPEFKANGKKLLLANKPFLLSLNSYDFK